MYMRRAHTHIIQEVDVGLEARVLIGLVGPGAAIPDEQHPATQRVQLVPCPGVLLHGEVVGVPLNHPEHLELGSQLRVRMRHEAHDHEQLTAGHYEIASADVEAHAGAEAARQPFYRLQQVVLTPDQNAQVEVVVPGDESEGTTHHHCDLRIKGNVAIAGRHDTEGPRAILNQSVMPRRRGEMGARSRQDVTMICFSGV